MIEDIQNCTGCGACYSVCPVDAIEMEFNKQGFYSPTVDIDKCIKCGQCKKTCPAIEYKSKNVKPKVYMVTAQDEERDKSTSGGAFGVLANYVLENNGYVCGVAWNEELEAEHIIITDKKDLDKLRISKYVQSKTADCFSKIKNLLDNDKLVLFSGTPCQNAGLIKFLNRNYDNLITVDLLCHGAPSPKVWQDYLEENFDKDKITDICFRKKNNNWEMGCASAVYNTANGYIKENEEKKEIGIYYEAFLRNILLNESCMECKYKFIPRPADFTIGDFWSWRKYIPEINPHKGLSVLLTNNKKAQNMLNKIKNSFKFIQAVNMKNWEDIEIFNKSKDNQQRKRFFEKYQKGNNLNKIINEAIGKHYDIGIVSFFNVMNYGSALVSYASEKILENLGYSILMINKDFNGFDNPNPQNRSLEFAQKHYNISKFYSKDADNRELNDLCDTFIVVSDTMWWDSEYAGDFAWLDFVRSDKRKVSFCTSFAHKDPAMNNNQRAKRKYLYKRFNALSVREESGVEILKNIFDVEATHLYDPTLIADIQVFEDLVKESKQKEKDFVFAYILDLTPEKEKAVKYVADKLNLKLKLISNMRYKGNSPLINENNVAIEDFVYFCKNADFIITDSFHGTCFSTIFEKPFISFINAWRGLERYQIFIDNNLKSNLIENTENIYNFDNFKQFMPDYTKFREKINYEKEKATKWLKNALEKPLPNITKEDYLYDYFYNEKVDTTQNYIDKDFYNNLLNKLEKKSMLIQKIFSVKNKYYNNKKYKVLTVLGIKIKFKISKNKF